MTYFEETTNIYRLTCFHGWLIQENRNLFDEVYRFDVSTKANRCVERKTIFRFTVAGSLIVTVFFGLTPVISRPNALAVLSFEATGSDENAGPEHEIDLISSFLFEIQTYPCLP